MKNLKVTEKELELLLNALRNHGVEDIDDENADDEEVLFNKILKCINKPVETTNEQPKKHNLLELFEDQFVINNPPITIYNSNKNVEIQLWGMAVILNEDGNYFITDTSGG